MTFPTRFVSASAAAALAASLCTLGHAAEGPVPHGVPHLDHVFVVVMENHGYSQILNNPNAPFINSLARSANLSASFCNLVRNTLW